MGDILFALLLANLPHRIDPVVVTCPVNGSDTYGPSALPLFTNAIRFAQCIAEFLRGRTGRRSSAV